jgi:hypothetical protein
MDLNDFHFLQSAAAEKLLEEAAGQDIARWALKWNAEGLPSHALATQLKCRERAKGKLPSWLKAGCLFEQTAFEQCSSESVATAKPWASGKKALDLTCGLGVDAWAMSHHYESVDCVEADVLRSQLSKFNFNRLGAHNLKVWQADAESWLRDSQQSRYDLVYIDPDRRPHGSPRRFKLEDCVPDILSLQGRLLEIAPRVLVKASPMLDIEAGLRVLHRVSHVWVMAYDGECKELLFELNESHSAEVVPVRGVIFYRSGKWHSWAATQASTQEPTAAPNLKYKFVYEADVSVYKAGVAPAWFADFFAGRGLLMHPDGYFFTEEEIKNFPGRSFRILAEMEWKPKAVKAYLKSGSISEINLSRRHFDLTIEQLRKVLSIKEGGRDYLLFTKISDGNSSKRMCYHAIRD